MSSDAVVNDNLVSLQIHSTGTTY